MFKNLKPKSKREMMWSIISSRAKIYKTYFIITIIWNGGYICIRNRVDAVIPIILGCLIGWFLMICIELIITYIKVNKATKQKSLIY